MMVTGGEAVRNGDFFTAATQNVDDVAEGLTPGGGDQTALDAHPLDAAAE